MLKQIVADLTLGRQVKQEIVSKSFIKASSEKPYGEVDQET